MVQNEGFRVVLMLPKIDYYNVLRQKVVVKYERFMVKRSYFGVSCRIRISF